MKLKCIDNASAADHLTEGEIYDASPYAYKTDGTLDRVKVVDDNGAFWYPFFDRFVLLGEE